MGKKRKYIYIHACAPPWLATSLGKDSVGILLRAYSFRALLPDRPLPASRICNKNASLKGVFSWEHSSKTRVQHLFDTPRMVDARGAPGPVLFRHPTLKKKVRMENEPEFCESFFDTSHKKDQQKKNERSASSPKLGGTRKRTRKKGKTKEKK